ncbi:hypothetical protein [Escherichia coli]|uniref:hypothetical protein n=1 Tax=Escherichia coli TaxID=562 RepID=UPI000373DBEB|nr:hypothetical protein [Escherichia coli]
MADWFIATEGVKVVKDSASLWPQIITAVSSAGAALFGVAMTHHFTRRREKEAAAEKKASEALFISTELVFLLEEFAENCALVAADSGERNQDGNKVSREGPPVLDLTRVTGDWRVLPAKLMYRIRELPILLTEARRYVASANENDDQPDYSCTFQEKQYQYSRLGLKALFSAIRLRKETGLPPTRLNATSWSVQQNLRNLWRQEHRRRSAQRRQELQTTAQLNVALQLSIKNNSLSGG